LLCSHAGFGRSFELVRRIDPGNGLIINGKAIEVAGDGSFKHFTKPFAGSVW
jgi:hypothetical protein